MPAYLLLLVAVLSRIIPHPWLNFTAVGGSLLYFGARRPLRQAILPVALLAATDYYLTVFTYNYPFHLSSYLLTWAWYAAVVLLGRVLLAERTSAIRLSSAIVLAPTSFFLVSNFAAWVEAVNLYPRSLSGLGMSYAAGLPFYRNDLISTALVAGLAFGLPLLARHSSPQHQIAGV